MCFHSKSAPLPVSISSICPPHEAPCRTQNYLAHASLIALTALPSVSFLQLEMEDGDVM